MFGDEQLLCRSEVSYFDSGGFERFESLFDADLQLILDARGTQQRHVLLDGVEGASHDLVAVALDRIDLEERVMREQVAGGHFGAFFLFLLVKNDNRLTKAWPAV